MKQYIIQLSKIGAITTLLLAGGAFHAFAQEGNRNLYLPFLSAETTDPVVSAASLGTVVQMQGDENEPPLDGDGGETETCPTNLVTWDDSDNLAQGLLGHRDIYYLLGGNDNSHAGDCNDELHGGQGQDILYGDAGNDKLYGGDGEDTIHGGAGRDTIYGENGDDNIRGNNGRDRLFGGRGNDAIYGDSGDDIINGNGGHDQLVGNGGNDTIDGGQGNDHISGYDGNDILTGGLGKDIIMGIEGDDILIGGDKDDKLYGGNGNDCAEGNAGLNKIWGDAGDDFLFAGSAQDIVRGGAGYDICYGGIQSGCEESYPLTTVYSCSNLPEETGLPDMDLVAVWFDAACTINITFANIGTANINTQTYMHMRASYTITNTPTYTGFSLPTSKPGALMGTQNTTSQDQRPGAWGQSVEVEINYAGNLWGQFDEITYDNNQGIFPVPVACQ